MNELIAVFFPTRKALNFLPVFVVLKSIAVAILFSQNIVIGVTILFIIIVTTDRPN